jgi:DNA-binding MarR family transcriptional regulator
MVAHEEVLISLRKIIRAIDLHSKRLERESGLTGPQLLILKAVGLKEDVTAGTIARDASLSQATVTSILDRLERKELLRRSRSQDDKRKVALTLTDSGRAILDAAPPLLQDSFIRSFNNLQQWEQSLILSSLQRLAYMMNAEDLDAAPLLDSTDAQVTPPANGH